MKESTARDCEVQLNAVLGFVLFLKSSPSDQSVESSEFTDQLLHVLRIYGWELNRRMDGEAATEDWINIVAVTLMLARMLIDDLVETHPELKAYQSADEPSTLDEMALHLLLAAADHFERYSRPEALESITDLVDRVVNASTP